MTSGSQRSTETYRRTEERETCDYEMVLDNLYGVLQNEIYLDPVFDELKISKVFQTDTLQYLSKLTTSTEKIDTLLKLLKKEGYSTYYLFKKCLRTSGQNALTDRLEAAEKDNLAMKDDPPMTFRCFIVPAKVYCKYTNMYNEAKPLWRRYGELSKKLGMEENRPSLPYAEEIRVLCLEQTMSEHLCANEVSKTIDKNFPCMEIPFERFSEETKTASLLVVFKNALHELKRQTELKERPEVIVLETNGRSESPEGYVTSTREQLATTIERCLQNKIKLSFQEALNVLQADVLCSKQEADYCERDDASSVSNTQVCRIQYIPNDKHLGLEETTPIQQPTKLECEQSANHQLERVRDAYRKHPELKEDAEQLYGHIDAMLYRFGMPIERKTQDSYKVLGEEDANELFQVEGVIRLGYKYNTLNICLDDSLDPKERQMVEREVEKLLKARKLLKYTITYEQKEPEYFAEVGSRLKTGLGKARIGGFANLGGKLCILLSKHAISKEHTEVRVENFANLETFVPFAKVLLPKTESRTDFCTDMAIAEILETKTNGKLQLKDEHGNHLPNILYSFDQTDAPRFLNNLSVHISRASGPTGLGVISIPMYKVRDLQNTMILIEDREPDEGHKIKRFAESGDSGSIICATDSSGDRVLAIGFFIGSTNSREVEKNSTLKGKYIASRLTDGFEQLKTEQDETDLVLL